ncbi:MAG TPA: TraB/GumN family protein [Kofleriaceae bacterium]|nr:TraB/GumN family protein [Kofleriaceae bacterium]
MRRALALVMLLGACSDRAERPAPAPPSSSPPAGGATDPWNAGPPARDTAPPAPTDPLPHPFVWAATKDGRTLTLIGTLHAGVDAKDRLPLWAWKRVEAAPALAVEVDPLDPDLTAWAVRRHDAPTLREELGEVYWAKLVDMLGERTLALSGFSSTAAIAMQVSGYGGNVEATATMDFILLQRAKTLGKRIVYLETARSQSELLASLFTLDALKRLVDHRDGLPGPNRRMFAAYEEGDLETFAASARQAAALQVADEAGLARLDAALLLDRNRAWIPALEELLAARGFEVRRLAE